MSHAASPSTERLYGVVRVSQEWEIPRSSFYAARQRQQQPACSPVRRGPKTRYSDQELLQHIRAVIDQGPFSGEGHRKIWARLRFQAIRTSKGRVLRLMRLANLLAPARRPPQVDLHDHSGSIVAERPNQIWGTDATAAFTRRDGRVTIFLAVDHCSSDCLGIHAAKKGTRFEALEPIRQGVRDYCGGFAEAVAVGIKLRHDHGSQFMADDYQQEVRFLGLESSPAFVRQPECNGCAERFIRTLKEQLLWVRCFDTVEELRQALLEFRQAYNQRWILQRHGYRTPNQVRQDLLALGAAA